MVHVESNSQTFRGPPDREIARIAAKQHGVVSIEQLRAAGLSDGAIKWRVATGKLHRVHRGVYAVGYKRVIGRGRLWAAVLACGGPGKAAISHRAAAAVYDLLPWPSGKIDVTPLGHRRAVPGIRVHRSRSLSLDDIRLDPEDGLPVTTVGRTLTDLADHLNAHGLKRLCHRAEHLRILDMPPPTPGRRTRKLDAALATLIQAPPQIPRNAFEERFLALAERAGLPPPRVNHDRGPYCLDFFFPELSLVVETDGARTHNSDAAFHADRRRDVDLKVAGVETVRLTWDHVVNDPDWVERALRAIAASRGLVTATPSPRRS